MSKPRQFWISKGSSKFCDELTFDDDGNDCKHTPDEFYDLVSPNDTIEGAIHVIEYSAYERAIRQRDEYKAKAEKLTEALKPGEHNSIRERLALMAEGEGSDPEVYRQLAKSALVQLDKVFGELRCESQ